MNQSFHWSNAVWVSRIATAFTLATSVVCVGCGRSQAQIDLPAAISGNAEVLVYDSETESLEHVQMPIEDAVDASGKTVVIDFWASWCGPCSMLVPELEAVGKQLGDNIVIVKVNVDENPALAQAMQVGGIPDVRFFKDRKAVGGFMGFRTADRIVPLLQD